MNKRIRRYYSDEFKFHAVCQVQETDKTAAEVALDLDISPSLLRRWCKDIDSKKPATPRKETLEEEVRRLRGELRSLKEDNDILKKAARYFAKESR